MHRVGSYCMSLITIVRQLAGYTYVYRQTDRQTDRQDNPVIVLITVSLLMKYRCKQADMFSYGQEPRTI